MSNILTRPVTSKDLSQLIAVIGFLALLFIGLGTAKTEKFTQEQKKVALSELTEKVTEIIHSSNKSVALSMVTYTMANVKYGGVTKADAYKIVKSSESTQGSLWSALSGVMQQFPQELKPYEDDLIGFDGGMMLISTSINSRKEAAAELANYLDTGSLKSLDQYEKKLRESMGFMAQGVNKVKKVGDELGVQVEITTTLDEAVEEVKTVLSDLEKYPFIAGIPSTENNRGTFPTVKGQSP